MIRTVAIVWLTFCSAFFLGLYVYSTQIWPYPIVRSVERFISGDVAESTTIVEKLMNDFNFKPARHIVHNKTEYAYRDYLEVDGLMLNKNRMRPLLFLSPKATLGYRVLYGVFNFEKTVHGVVLFNPDGEVHHVWYTSQEGVGWGHQPDANVYPHGFEIASDGSIVVAYDSGTSLTKYDWCGNVVWQIMGGFHHSISFDGQGALWTWGNTESDEPYGQYLVKIDYETGEVLRKFHLFEIYDANPEIDTMGMRQADTPEKSEWLLDVPGDILHANDIDPLPPDLALHYPQFNVGDLLISLRSPNLIFVMDPETHRIKWWRQGAVRRQHDPDWNDQGTITIFNNNMHRGYSSIVEMDPVTLKTNKVVAGDAYGFYTWVRGKHQRIPGGGYLITSTEQGRVFEVNSQGEVTFEFINRYGENNEFLAISEARYLPMDFFKGIKKCNK